MKQQAAVNNNNYKKQTTRAKASNLLLLDKLETCKRKTCWMLITPAVNQGSFPSLFGTKKFRQMRKEQCDVLAKTMLAE